MSFLFSYLRPHRKMLSLVLVLATVNQIFSLMDPQVLRWLIDNYLTQSSHYSGEMYFKGIIIGLVALITVAMVSRLAKNFQDYLTNVMTQQIGTDIYQGTIAHTFSLPYAAFEDQQSGQLLQKLIKAKESIQTYISSLISVVFFSLVGVVFVLCYSFWIDWRVGFAYALLMPIVGFTTFSLSQKIKQSQEKISQQSNILSGSITESIRNVSLIKMLGLVAQEITRIQLSNKKILNLELDKVKRIRTMEFLQGTLINAMRVCLIGLLAYLVYQKVISVGELLSLYFYSFFLFGQLSQFATVVKNYQEARANHDILQDIMTLPIEPSDDHLLHIDQIKTIELRDVSFFYHQDHYILHHIDVSRKAGQTIAFVGPSGSGKSTLLKLICGLYRPTHGSVYINGYDGMTINYTDLKKRIGIVSQDAQLFSGTIRENLSFVSPYVTDEDIHAVLLQAALDSFVAGLPDGIDTTIGEGGIKLSGGQKQRLAIARALLRQPQLLVMDEATSALDSITEKEIAETIEHIGRIRPDLMIILVAHRLSTVMAADMIYVMERGHIVEQGNHDYLVDMKGLYYAMWREQSGQR